MNPTRLLCLVCIVALAGCDESDDTDAGGPRDAGSMSDDAGPGTDGGDSVDAGAPDGGVSADAGDVDGGPGFVCTDAPDSDALVCGSLGGVLAAGGASYVVRWMDVAQPDDMGLFSVGFDLDGMDSGAGSSALDANCEEFNADYTDDLTAMAGVDNAFGSLAPTLESLTDGCLMHDVLTAPFADGDELLIVTVSGVDDMFSDPDVTVEISMASVSSPPMLDASSGLIAPGQTFALGTSVGTFTGSLLDGRVDASGAGVTLRSGGSFLAADLANARIAFDLCDDGLTSGVVAGAANVDDLVSAASALDPSAADAVRAVFENVADLNPSAGDPAICDDMSATYSFTAVPAVLVSP